MLNLRALFIALPLVFAVGCGDDNNEAPKDGAVDAGVDSPPDASCFDNPQTYQEIINACTSAQKIYKDSRPPLLNPDGTLPPLPQ